MRTLLSVAGVGRWLLLVLLVLSAAACSSDPSGECQAQCAPGQCDGPDGCGGVCSCDPAEEVPDDPAGGKPGEPGVEKPGVLSQPCGADCQPPLDLEDGTWGLTSECHCVPSCKNKQCGPDGCGGTCGHCTGGRACLAGKCVCVPSCKNKLCGPDGCGGSCGTCAGPNDVCQAGKCVCAPSCEGKQCGPDGCGGVCGVCGGPQEVCDAGQCVCVPACDGKVCGPDGCGGVCGVCSGPQEVCDAGQCVCVPACYEKQCGPDGCGAQCGVCEDWETCDADLCVPTGEPGDCADILLCAVACEVYGDCIDACLDESTFEGKKAYDSMTDCSDATCAAFENGSAPKQLCLVQACPDPWSVCIGGWGVQDCLGILNCLPGCKGQRPCQWECIFAATDEAQELFWITQTCVEFHCAECGDDSACLDACISTNCLTELLTCEGCYDPCPTCGK